MENGYRLVLVPGHPMARKSGHVLEHRLVMAQKLGRVLEPGEAIHHINEIKTDNRPENLQLVSYSDHMKLHKHWNKSPETERRRQENRRKAELAFQQSNEASP